jgi:ABC-2 type transport system permease protein
MLSVLLQQVRRDRIVLPIWVLGTAALLTVSAASVVNEYGDAEGRTQILTVALATPALLSLRGIPNGDSLGSAVHFQSYAFLAVTIGLMNVFLATRHGRADEEKGRRELLLAAPVSRLTPPVATLVLAIVANAVFAVLAVLGYLSAGLPAEGAVLSATALAATGLVFFGVGMLAGELTATTRAASGIGVVLVLVAYALRAAGDALGTPDVENLTLEPAWPSWLSPIGWGQQTFAFTDDIWWPVAALGGLAVVFIAVALVVHSRRELGASLLAERQGSAAARPTLRGAFGLAWRLHWPTLLAWTLGSALLGLGLGSLITAVSQLDFADNPQLAAILQSLGHTDQSDAAAALIPALMVIVGSMAGAAGVQAVLRAREEEAAGRAETLLAAPVSRIGWLLAFTVLGVVTVAVVLLATGLASAAGFAASGSDEFVWQSFGQCLVQAPAALAFVAVTALVVGLLPRVAIGLGWGLFGAGVVIGYFGQVLQLPDWLLDVSPITHVPEVPVDDWGPTLLLAAIAVVIAVLGVAAFRRRDLST